MVFQQPNPFRKSIRDNITFAPKRHGQVMWVSQGGVPIGLPIGDVYKRQELL